MTTTDKPILYPGRTVAIGEPTGETDALVATVFPVGVRHVRRFAAFLDKALPKIVSAARAAGEGEGAGAQAMGDLLPLLLDDGVALVSECVSLPEGIVFDDLSHFDVAKVVAAWIEESFSEKKMAAWKTMHPRLGSVLDLAGGGA